MVKILEFSNKLSIESQYFKTTNMIKITINLAKKHLSDQRRLISFSSQNDERETTHTQNETEKASQGRYGTEFEEHISQIFNLENLAGLPKDLKWAFYYLNNFNLTKNQDFSQLQTQDTKIQLGK